MEKESEPKWTVTHYGSGNDADIKWGRFEGNQLYCLFGSLIIAFGVAVLLQKHDWELKPAVLIASSIPISVYGILLCLVIDKPKFYALDYIEALILKLAKKPLFDVKTLTEDTNDES